MRLSIKNSSHSQHTKHRAYFLMLLLLASGIAFWKYRTHQKQVSSQRHALTEEGVITENLSKVFPTIRENLATRTEFILSKREVKEQEINGIEPKLDKSSGIKRQPILDSASILRRKEISLERSVAMRSAKSINTPRFKPFFPSDYTDPFIIEGGGVKIAIRPVNSERSSAQTEDGKVIYRGIYPDTDSLHTANANRSEEFLVLHTSDAPTRFEYEISEATGVDRVEKRDGGLHFIGADGRGLQIEAPWVIDAKGKKDSKAVFWEISPKAANSAQRLSLVLNTENLTYPLLIDPTWVYFGPPILFRFSHTETLLLNGEVLIAGGATSGGDDSNSEVYDPRTGKSSFTNMNIARADHTAILLDNGLVLVAGGDISSPEKNTAELYNPTTRTWTRSRNMLVGRSRHTATLLLDRRVLIVGGSSSRQDAEIYDPAGGTWQLTDKPVILRPYGHTATRLLDGRVLVAGGGIEPTTKTFLATNSTEIYDPKSGKWSMAGSLNEKRGYHTATLLPDGKVLAVGGYEALSDTGVFEGKKTVEIYDPTTNVWTLTTSMSVPRVGHAATLLPNSKVLIAGGYSNSTEAATRKTEIYDPTTGIWSATGDLNEGRVTSRTSEAIRLSDGKVLMIGEGTYSAEIYDPTIGVWREIRSLSEWRDLPSATLLPNNKVLIAGGYDLFKNIDSAEIFDPATNVWTVTGRLNTARRAHTATLLPDGKKVLVVGGEDNVGNLASAELFDIETGKWTPSGSLSTPRSGHSATLLSNGKVLVAGGFSGSARLMTAEIYDPTTGSWASTGNLKSTRIRHSAVALRDGRVLVVGGDGPTNFLSTAEIYNPTTGEWAVTGNLKTGRDLLEATLLNDGKVLVTGGFNNGYLDSAELYDPSTGMWRPAGNLKVGRVYHSATLLPSGRLLVVGGRKENDGTPENYFKSVEIYDPVTGSWSEGGDLNVGRSGHRAVLLTNNNVLVAGGWDGIGYKAGFSTEIYQTLPDLQVADIPAPLEVLTGTPFDLRWTVKNTGDYTANGPWTDKVYFSTNSELGIEDILLATLPFNGTLSAGQTVDRHQSITIPKSAVPQDGNYYVMVVADSDNNVNEFPFEGNNRNSIAIPVKIDRTPPVIDGPIVSEIGKRSARIQWSTNELTTGTVQYAIGDGPFVFASKSAGISDSHSVVISPLSSNTQYRVKIVAQDNSENESESQIKNFTTEKRVDLAVSDLAISNLAPSSGDSITVSAKVSNISDTAATATLVFYDSSPRTGTREVGRKQVSMPAKAPDMTISSDPFVVIQGSHALNAQLQNVQPIDEFSGNNQISGDLNVGAPAAQFTVSISPPKTWPGNEGIFSAVVKNTGSTPQVLSSVRISGVPWVSLTSKLPEAPLAPGESAQLTFKMVTPAAEQGGGLDAPIRKEAVLEIQGADSPQKKFSVLIYNSALAKLNVVVVDALTRKPIKGAVVSIDTTDQQWITGDDGKPVDPSGNPALILTAPGAQLVSAYAKDYDPNQVSVMSSPISALSSSSTVNTHLKSAEQQPSESEIALKSGLIIESITEKPLTAEEIKARGINLDDPNNYSVSDFVINVSGGEATIPNIVVPNNIGGGFSFGSGFCIESDVQKCGEVKASFSSSGGGGRRETWLIVIPGKIRFLKQFWQVTMLIRNASLSSIDNVEASLTVPNGLSLPVLSTGPQTEKRSIGSLAPSASKKEEWILRGDVTNTYFLTGEAKGTFNGQEINTSLRSSGITVIKPTVKMTYTIPPKIEGRFSIEVNVKNESPITLEGVEVFIDKEKLVNCVLVSEAKVLIGSIKPGEAKTIVFSFTTEVSGCVKSTNGSQSSDKEEALAPTIEVQPIEVVDCKKIKTPPVASIRGPLAKDDVVVDEIGYDSSFNSKYDFKSTSYDPDNNGGQSSNSGIVSWEWKITLPDGTSEVFTERDIQGFSPSRPVEHGVSLTVKDDDGDVSTSSRKFTVAQRRLLIFIPGTGASVLRDFNIHDDVFPITLNLLNYYDRISLDPEITNNLSPVPYILPTNVLRFNAISRLAPRYLLQTVAYENLLKTLVNKGGYREHKRTDGSCLPDQLSQSDGSDPLLFVFPWDFRERGEWAAISLAIFIDCIRSKHPEHKVDILAHSQGGLISKLYLLSPDSKGKVSNLITIGTPWLGAPKTIATLENGTFWGDWKDDVDPIHPRNLKKVAPFFHGIHELIPGEQYYQLGGSYFGEDNWDVNNDGVINQNFTSIEAASLLDKQFPGDRRSPGTWSLNYHSKVGHDDWTAEKQPEVKYHHIVGYQLEPTTIGKILARNVPLMVWDPTNRIYVPEGNINIYDTLLTRGDGTVPIVSSSRISSDGDLNSPDAKVYFVAGGKDDLSAQHTGMVENPIVQKYILEILKVGLLNNSEKIDLTSTDRATNKKSGKQNSTNKYIGDYPLLPSISANYIRFIGTGAVTISDENGIDNTPDPNDPSRGILRGVNVFALGEESWLITVPSSKLYTFSITSGDKPFWIEVSKGFGTPSSTIKSIKYQDIKLNTGTKIEMALKETGEVYLRYDSDNNGTFDTGITPTVSLNGAAAQDSSAPAIVIQTSKQNGGYLVEILASDAESGVKSIYYSLNDKEYILYSSPFVANQLETPKIYVFAEDKAANRSGIFTYQFLNITDINPAVAVAGGSAFTLRVNGNGYVNGSTVQWNGSPRPTTFVSDTQLTAAILASDIATAGMANITVLNPSPGSASNTITFTILPQPYPVPTITSISPNSAIAGKGAFTLTVTGTNFVNVSKVRWNGNNLVTSVVGTTQLLAQVPASLITSAGEAQITILNPDPGGGTSNSTSFIITTSAYEADLAPRPFGDGKITSADWEVAGLFFIGLDIAAEGSEFRRADSAPRNSLGDGKITLADWVQAGRYAAGLDPVTDIGGPMNQSAFTTTEPLGQSGGALRVLSTTFQRGQINTLQIEMDAQANENAVAFTINYDPKQLSFVDAALSQELNEAKLLVNSTRVVNGQIGIAFALPAGKVMLAGTSRILTLRFVPIGGANDVMTKVSFGDQVVRGEVVDVMANGMTGMTFGEGAILVTGSAVAHVSAADYVGPMLAVESIATAFGTDLAAQERRAENLPLPTTLEGTAVKVKDSKGAERLAPLFYVSPGQVNYQIPEGTTEGIATVTITNANNKDSSGLIQAVAVEPGLFSADATGKGIAAALILRVKPDGTQIYERIVTFDQAMQKFVPVPIDLSFADDQVFLVMFGTGIRHRKSLEAVKVSVGGLDCPVEFAGTQGMFTGLDQVNIKLLKNLAGRGEVDLRLSVDTQIANTLKVHFK